MAQLREMNRTARTVGAVQTREMSKLLGLPRLDLKDDEMLAAGDININQRGVGPWIFASVLVLAFAGCVAGWGWSRPFLYPQPSIPQVNTKDYIDIEVIPGPQ